MSLTASKYWSGVRREQLALVGLDEAADDRLLDGVGQLVGLDDRRPRLRLGLRRSDARPARSPRAARRPRSCPARARRRSPPRRTGPTAASRCTKRPAQLGVDGQALDRLRAVQQAVQQVQLLRRAGRRRRTRGPRPAGGRCPARRPAGAPASRPSSGSAAPRGPSGSAYRSIASFTWRCSDCTTPMSDSLPMPDSTSDR